MDYQQVLSDFAQLFGHMKQRLIEFLPHVMGAVAIFLVGLVVARFLRALTTRVLRNIGRLIADRKIQSRLHPARLERAAGVISSLLYWIVIFFFLTVATETLGLPVISTWLSGIASYLPKIMVAALIGVAGILGGMLLRDLITAAAASAGMSYANILGKSSQYAILTMTFLIGIEQIGIRIVFLTNLIIILIASMLLGTALAFGLGAMPSIRNILGSYYLQKMYRVGYTIRIGDIEGKIVQITPVAVILENSEGRIYIPAKKFNEMKSVLRRKEPQNE